MSQLPDSEESQNEKLPQLSPWAQAMQTVSNVTTAVLLILVCGGLGYGIDHWLNWTLLAPIGCLLGTYLAIRYLLTVVKLK